MKGFVVVDQDALLALLAEELARQLQPLRDALAHILTTARGSSGEGAAIVDPDTLRRIVHEELAPQLDPLVAIPKTPRPLRRSQV